MATGRPKRKRRSKIKRTDKVQSARFVAAAKAMGLDESGKAFDKAMRSLLKVTGKRGSN